MIKIIFTLLSYIILFFNTNVFSFEKSDELKIGLLAPFSGKYKNLGNSLILSTQLALDEINNDKIKIIPRDSGSNDKEKLNNAIKEIIDQGANIIIGPTDSKDFDQLSKYKDTIFISLSNMHPETVNNIISIGISLDSQLTAIENLIKKEKRTKTLIMYPINEYTKFIDEKIKTINLKNYKIFKYNPDPKVLTGEIEKLTNYSQRKRNLEFRKKLLEEKDDEASKRELAKLEQIYTLGKVNFDSLIIIDFGNSLKSVLASLVFSDVEENQVLYTTVNQWFDESIFYENSVKNLYYPSVNFKNFNKYNDKYFSIFKTQPNEITLLAYDAMGLIYYIWKTNNGIGSINDFFIKEKIKGKIGNFKFEGKKITQELNIYKTHENSFKKY